MPTYRGFEIVQVDKSWVVQYWYDQTEKYSISECPKFVDIASAQALIDDLYMMRVVDDLIGGIHGINIKRLSFGSNFD